MCVELEVYRCDCLLAARFLLILNYSVVILFRRLGSLVLFINLSCHLYSPPLDLNLRMARLDAQSSHITTSLDLDRSDTDPHCNLPALWLAVMLDAASSWITLQVVLGDEFMVQGCL